MSSGRFLPRWTRLTAVWLLGGIVLAGAMALPAAPAAAQDDLLDEF